MNRIIAICFTTAILASCSSTTEQCEDPAEVKKQIQQCQLLNKQMKEAKGQPIRLQELERRYEQDCVKSRYYKDDHQVNSCKVEKG